MEPLIARAGGFHDDLARRHAVDLSPLARGQRPQALFVYAVTALDVPDIFVCAHTHRGAVQALGPL
ncbi:hypothetical protein ACWGNM_00665 [Streptomyces sp. NPDC055796]